MKTYSGARRQLELKAEQLEEDVNTIRDDLGHLIHKVDLLKGSARVSLNIFGHPARFKTYRLNIWKKSVFHHTQKKPQKHNMYRKYC